MLAKCINVSIIFTVIKDGCLFRRILFIRDHNGLMYCH